MLTVRGGYHGDTFGCMSVCDPVGGMHSMFSDVLPAAGLRRPAARPTTPTSPAWAESFERLADEHAHELAGIIVEPLLQGAGGMHVYPAECLRVMREVADRHDLVLVFDEIATGFGRTGTFFAAEAAGVTPDIMCVGKALTGRLPHPGRGALHAAGRRTGCPASRVRRAHARADVHGQPARLLGRARQPRPARDRRLAEPGRPDQRRADRRARAAPRACPAWPTSARIGAVGVVQLDHPVDVVKATDAALDQRRLAAPVPRPRLHDAAVHLHRRRDRRRSVRRSSAAVDAA